MSKNMAMIDPICDENILIACENISHLCWIVIDVSIERQCASVLGSYLSELLRFAIECLYCTQIKMKEVLSKINDSYMIIKCCIILCNRVKYYIYVHNLWSKAEKSNKAMRIIKRDFYWKMLEQNRKFLNLRSRKYFQHWNTK